MVAENVGDEMGLGNGYLKTSGMMWVVPFCDLLKSMEFVPLREGAVRDYGRIFAYDTKLYFDNIVLAFL